jgi:hypothetical protein
MNEGTMAIRVNSGDRSMGGESMDIERSLSRVFNAMPALVFIACSVFSIPAARAQTTSYAPIVVTPPIIDMVDETHVSLISGKPNFEIPAVKLGDVSFEPFYVNGESFEEGQILDDNYGHILICNSPTATNSYAMVADCVSSQYTIQAVYGQERAPCKHTVIRVVPMKS